MGIQLPQNTLQKRLPGRAVPQPLLFEKYQRRLPATCLPGEGEAAFLPMLPSKSVLGLCLVCPGQWAVCATHRVGIECLDGMG